MKEDKKYKPGDKAFYNNGPVEILEIKPGDFALVKAYVPITTEIHGSNFCTPCNVGGPGVPGTLTHTCRDAQEIIEAIIEEIQETCVFFVPVALLQSAPYEYVKWVGIQKEIEKLKEEREKLLKDKAAEEIMELRERKRILDNEVRVLKRAKDDLRDEIAICNNSILSLSTEIDKAKQEKAKLLGEKTIEDKPQENRFDKLELD